MEVVPAGAGEKGGADNFVQSIRPLYPKKMNSAELCRTQRYHFSADHHNDSSDHFSAGRRHNVYHCSAKHHNGWQWRHHVSDHCCAAYHFSATNTASATAASATIATAASATAAVTATAATATVATANAATATAASSY